MSSKNLNFQNEFIRVTNCVQKSTKCPGPEPPNIRCDIINEKVYI